MDSYKRFEEDWEIKVVPNEGVMCTCGQGETYRPTHNEYMIKGDTGHCAWMDERIDTIAMSMGNSVKSANMFGKEPTVGRVYLKKYIINTNAAILFWSDGDKTVVKRTKKDKFDKRAAFLNAYFQKASGLTKTKANKYLNGLVVSDD